MLTSVLKVLVNNSVKESFYWKKKKNNQCFDRFFYFL